MPATEIFTPTSYKLLSVASGRIFSDSGWLLDAPDETEPTLIRALYQDKQLVIHNGYPGLYRFAGWLPVRRLLEGSSAPVTYKSKGLAGHLGLTNLYITFSGWWPEQGAFMKTCSFKETEAYSVCARMSSSKDKILVVASAGNTARSFARVCSDNRIPLLLCMPQDNIDSLWFDTPLHECVKLAVTESGSDYFDAIHLSNIICKSTSFRPEGGARNVARRDGMGTTVLSAVTAIGSIPEYYFQAIGSGTGAIAAWEANLRLLEDGRFGQNKMRLMVSQNEPFVPIKEAWEAQSRHMLPLDEQEGRRRASLIGAKVLSNRKPPYPPAGGLYDALIDTGGEVLSATNEEGRSAAALFKQTEGIDIHPAAAIATATLVKQAENKKLPSNALIMLNITGGGEEKFRKEKPMHFLAPHLVFSLHTAAEADIQALAEGLFGE